MDRNYHMLREKGVGIERKQAEFISPEDESDVGKGGASHRHTTGSNTDRFFLQWQEFCLRDKNIRHFGCLNSFMTMASEAGLSGNYTNHSLRVTGTTSLFDAGVPEAIIQKRTGHKSVDALRC